MMRTESRQAVAVKVAARARREVDNQLDCYSRADALNDARRERLLEAIEDLVERQVNGALREQALEDYPDHERPGEVREGSV